MSIRQTKDVENLDWVNEVFSAERMKPYLDAVQGDLSGALTLYGLNVRVSLEIFGWLAVLEVVLRNSILKSLANSAYKDVNSIDLISQDLSPDGRASYKKTEARIRRTRSNYSWTSVTAELPFSFWKHLLSSRYETNLWTKHLRHAFPHLWPRNRAIAFRSVEAAVELRNRIAHHEPIFRRQLGEDLRQIQEIIGWISPEALAWAKVNLPKLPDFIGIQGV